MYMNAGTRRLTLGSLLVPSLAWVAQAAEPSGDAQAGNQRRAASQWTLSSDDTELIVRVSHHEALHQQSEESRQNWNWLPVPCEVPLPGPNSITTLTRTDYSPNWAYCGATEARADGHTLTLRFTSAMPHVELKSVWQAYPGPGPVENWVTIENKSGGNVAYGPTIAAARLRIKADHPVHLHRAEKTNVGKGKVYYDPLGRNARITTNSGTIPLIMFDVAATHGMYLGYEWELGGFQVASASDPLDITASAHPLTEKVTRGNHCAIRDSECVLWDLSRRHRRRQQQVQEVVLEPQDHAESLQARGRAMD